MLQYLIDCQKYVISNIKQGQEKQKSLYISTIWSSLKIIDWYISCSKIWLVPLSDYIAINETFCFPNLLKTDLLRK